MAASLHTADLAHHYHSDSIHHTTPDAHFGLIEILVCLLRRLLWDILSFQLSRQPSRRSM